MTIDKYRTPMLWCIRESFRTQWWIILPCLTGWSVGAVTNHRLLPFNPWEVIFLSAAMAFMLTLAGAIAGIICRLRYWRPDDR